MGISGNNTQKKASDFQLKKFAILIPNLKIGLVLRFLIKIILIDF